MFEIRSRMAPDVQDLKKHVEPQAVTKRLTARIKDRIRNTVSGTVGGLVDSAKRQANSAREAGRKRDPSAFADSVKSDPKPLALLAVVLFITLMMARKISNGRG